MLPVAVFASLIPMGMFWYADAMRRRALPGTLARLQSASRVVVLSPSLFVYYPLWFVYAAQRTFLDPEPFGPVMRVLVSLVAVTMVLSALQDLFRLRQAWHESRWPGELSRLRARVRRWVSALRPAASLPAAGAA